MMYKWTMPSQITQIGLNFILLISFSGCCLFTECGLFNWDPASETYSDRYINNTSQDISLCFSAPIRGDSTFSLASQSFFDRSRLVRNDDSAIEQLINKLYGESSSHINIIYLILSSDTIQIWSGPPAFMDDSINSPFNYNSWEINHEDKSVVEFTITEADIQ